MGIFERTCAAVAVVFGFSAGPAFASAYWESCESGVCDPSLLVTHDIHQMSDEELRELFCGGRSYPVPVGRSTHRSVTRPSNIFISELVSLNWESKVFTPAGLHVNVNLFGVSFGKGHVSETQSLYAEQACGAGFGEGAAVIVDYSAYSAENSRLHSRLRDEFREVTPCLYIGVGMIRDSEMEREDLAFRNAHGGLRNYLHYHFGVFVALDFRPGGNPLSGGRECLHQPDARVER